LTVIKVKADLGNPGGLDTVAGPTLTLGSNVSSVTITADTIDIVFTSNYVIPNFPIFTGTVYWYNGTPNRYSIIQIPSSTNFLDGSGILNMSYLPNTRTLSIGPINATTFANISNDLTGGAFALYLFLQVFN
jgi:hypothetical protein